MSSSLELQKRIESCHLQHRAFMTLYEHLHTRIDDACRGTASRIEWVIGPSRVGKSMLIDKLVRDFPERKVEHGREVPVLSAVLPPSVSPLMLPTSFMTALNVPVPTRGATTGALNDRLYKQLKKAGTRALIVDEASHIVDVGTKVPPRAAGDWFKSIADSLDMTLILFGVPRLRRLFESNEQLQLRASQMHEFRPYDYRIPVERNAFAQCVSGYTRAFETQGWSFELTQKQLVPNCYLLSGGLVGVLSRFMQELASQMRHQSPRAITLQDCRSAAARIHSAGNPDYPAFKDLEVPPAATALAYGAVLKTNQMTIPTIDKAQVPA